MGIYAPDVRKYIIKPVLEYLGLWSQSAETLLIGTLAQESGIGARLHQVQGPALGAYQIEPATHTFIADDYLCPHKSVPEPYLSIRRALGIKVRTLLAPFPPAEEQLISNLYYQTAICRIKYKMIREPLPDADDIYALGEYWKKYYNANPIHGSADQFVKNYMALALG